MKKISIIGLSLLIAACSSGSYTTDVTSESYTEEFKPQVVVAAVPESDKMNETSVEPVSKMTANETQVVTPAKSSSANTVKLTSDKPQSKKVKIIAPEQKHREKVQRFGYTLQVIAVDSSAKADSLASQLPYGTPIWEHYKQVKGTDWYALLYGDYETKSEAKAAIRTLPSYFQNLKPFVKSLDDIKNSEYPKLRKIR